ncbi:MAG: hypothetical protein ABFR95_06275 [Actinomycetota bacterium]
MNRRLGAIGAAFGLLVLLSTLVVAHPVDASSAYIAVQSGDWDEPETWGGSVPIVVESSDSVLIPSGVTVTVREGSVVELVGGVVVSEGVLRIFGEFLFHGGDEAARPGPVFDNRGTLRVSDTGVFDFDGVLYWSDSQGGYVTSGEFLSSGPINSFGVFSIEDAKASNSSSTVNQGVFTIGAWTGYLSGGVFTNVGTVDLYGPLGFATATLENLGSFTSYNGSSVDGGRFINLGVAQNFGTFSPGAIINQGEFENYNVVEKLTLGGSGSTINRMWASWYSPRISSGILVNDPEGIVVVGNQLLVDEKAGLLNHGTVDHTWGAVINNGTIADVCGGTWLVDDTPGTWSGNSKKTWCDTTPPRVLLVVNGSLGDNGWYRSDVEVNWSTSDAGSAVIFDSGCGSAQVTEDTTGVTFTCVAVSAGGTTTRTIVIKKDTVVPVVRVLWDDGNTALQTNQWLNHELKASFYILDDLSGTGSCDEPVILGEGEDQLVEGSCTDGAGNLGTFSPWYRINVDLTPPTVTWDASGESNANGWYNTDVTVLYSGSDALSGIDYCDDPVTFDQDGSGQHAWRACWDIAGNSNEVSPTINLDKTPPTVTARLSTSANSHGWHKTDVDVIFEGSDATSGIAFCDLVEFEGVEGAGLSASGACTDLADNVGGTVTVENINIDRTDPVLGFSEAMTSYLLSDSVNITCVASDALSGIEAIKCVGADGYGYEFDHTAGNWVSGSTWDWAGNAGYAASSFTIQVTRAGIDFVIDQYVADEKLARDLKGELDKVTKSIDKKKDRDKTADRMLRFEDIVLQGISQDDLTSDEADHLITLVRFYTTPTVSVTTIM